MSGIQKEKKKQQNIVYSFACRVNERLEGERRACFRPDHDSERRVID